MSKAIYDQSPLASVLTYDLRKEKAPLEFAKTQASLPEPIVNLY